MGQETRTCANCSTEFTADPGSTQTLCGKHQQEKQALREQAESRVTKGEAEQRPRLSTEGDGGVEKRG